MRSLFVRPIESPSGERSGWSGLVRLGWGATNVVRLGEQS